MITSPAIGAIGFVVLLILIFLGFPIGFTMAIIGTVGLLLVKDVKATLWAVDSVIFHQSFHWTYIVLPMFFLMGYFAFYGGIGRDTYEAANKWLGKIRGGLIIATISTCAAMGFACGSSLATTATFTKLALPEMKRHGYDTGISTGAIACAGTLAALIPPSGMMVIITVLTGMSLGKLMIAGIIPGLLTAAIFIAVLKIYLKVRPDLAPTIDTHVPLKEKIFSLRWTGPLIAVIFSILGGIYFGVFTPTEAGALGGFVTFVYFIIRKGFRYKEIFQAMIDTIKVCCMIFIIIIGAMIFTRFLVASGFIDHVSNFILGVKLSKYLILISILFVWLIMGCFMEVVAILALTTPIFYPVLIELGFNDIWIGILALMLMEIGVITPPVGTNVYVVKSVAGEEATLEQIFRGIFPFFVGYLLSVALIVAFPKIALWLPSLMKF